jgi:hypothetical protein
VGESSGFDAWYLHEKLIMNLLPPEEARDLGQLAVPLPPGHLPSPARVDAFERAVTRYLDLRPVTALTVQLLRGEAYEGSLTFVEQAIAFKGLGAALVHLEQHADATARATFSARITLSDVFEVRGDYGAARITCNTARSRLTGTSRQFVLGYIERLDPRRVTLRPIIIGTRWFHPEPELGEWHPVDPLHIWPGAVDQFAGVDFSQHVAKADLDILRRWPEAAVKAAFAEVLGEPDVPLDWGGERFDLWTTRLFVRNQPLRAAFLFKGPSEFKPMTIGSLGKNGDQLDRLSTTPADVLVIQHCHSITAPVVGMLRAYAASTSPQRRYLLIDGYDTVKILSHFGHIAR